MRLDLKPLAGDELALLDQAAKPVVALYYRSLRGPAGGAERMITWLANGLSARGLDIVMISLDDEDDAPFYPLADGIRWFRIGRRRTLKDKVRRTLRIAEILRREGAAALLGFVMSGDLTALTAGRLAGVKIIAAERNAPLMYWILYAPWRRRLNFAQLRLAHAVVVQQPAFSSSYPGFLRAKILSIANPVERADLCAKADAKTASGRLSVLSVGRIENRQKQIGLLVEAFAGLAADFPDWDLTIVGDGPDLPDVAGRVDAAGLRDRVNFKAATKDVFRHYAEANLFVLPSAWEGFPNSLAEAMAHGLPGVGFAEAEGVRDLLSEGGGWLASGEDSTSALRKALAEAMSDGAERRRRGEAARAQMAQFSPEVQLDQWIKLLASVGAVSNA